MSIPELILRLHTYDTLPRPFSPPKCHKFFKLISAIFTRSNVCIVTLNWICIQYASDNILSTLFYRNWLPSLLRSQHAFPISSYWKLQLHMQRVYVCIQYWDIWENASIVQCSAAIVEFLYLNSPRAVPMCRLASLCTSETFRVVFDCNFTQSDKLHL